VVDHDDHVGGLDDDVDATRKRSMPRPVDDGRLAPERRARPLLVDEMSVDFRSPDLVGFQQALAFVREIERPRMPTLVALDQPTIVPNESGMRPVEKSVASVISWMGGGVQPASRGRLAMFGPQAPIWAFLKKLGATENPEASRTAMEGRHVMEVFPALALASFDTKFFGRLMGPRYNPVRRKTFRRDDWHAVIAAAGAEAERFRCRPVVGWLEDLRGLATPTKSTQDRLDAALCLLIAIRWRLGARDESIVLGDLQTGYIVAPVSPAVMARLSQDASGRGVPVNAL
jgi:predicted RNase H-like nuclease